jgi:hypothetical protein
MVDELSTYDSLPDDYDDHSKNIKLFIVFFLELILLVKKENYLLHFGLLL